MTPQKNQAIQTALTGNWEAAIVLNEEILKEDPHDIDTLNRLAFAYTAIGKNKEAKSTYQKVLELDIFNPIAIKNLKKLGGSKTTTIHGSIQMANNMFLEENGKTKIVNLINTAQPKILEALQIGQSLKICIKRSKIFVLDESDQFIGMLPDSVGRRLMKFIIEGNQYVTYVKALEGHTVAVFIREEKRASKFKDISSFLSNETTTSLPINKHKKQVDHASKIADDED